MDLALVVTLKKSKIDVLRIETEIPWLIIIQCLLLLLLLLRIYNIVFIVYLYSRDCLLITKYQFSFPIPSRKRRQRYASTILTSVIFIFGIFLSNLYLVV